MTQKDESAVAYAVAETFNSLIEGYSRHGAVLSVENVKSLLYYHLNPWCTDGSFDFLAEVCRQLKEKAHEDHSS